MSSFLRGLSCGRTAIQVNVLTTLSTVWTEVVSKKTLTIPTATASTKTTTTKTSTTKTRKMKPLDFSKYEGAGNDFIAIDNMSSTLTLTLPQRHRLCSRKTGIGADGILELKRSHLTDCSFKLVYYNADGNEGSLCGNGARCSLAFAQSLGLIHLEANQQTVFEACDGVHQGGMLENGQYFVDMREVALEDIKCLDDGNYFLNNGSPHHVTFITNINEVDVIGTGRELRWKTYGDAGSNINFVQTGVHPFSPNAPSAQLSGGCIGAEWANDDIVVLDSDSHLAVRTYERGVEDETLACGTGACASAVVAYLRHQKLSCGKNVSTDTNSPADACSVTTKTTFVSMTGGQLRVQFEFNGHSFRKIKLSGPVNHVFEGQIHLSEN